MIKSSVTITEEDFMFCEEFRINKSQLLRKAIDEEKQRKGFVRGATIKELNNRLAWFMKRSEKLTERLEEFAPHVLEEVNEQLIKEEKQKCLELRK